MRIVCFGDSITRAADFPENDRWPLRLRDRLVERGLAAKIYNRGVSGHTSAQGLDRFGEDVLPLLPATVLVQFGFNDANVRDWSLEPRVSVAEYLRNLDLIHRLITRAGGQCIFIVNHQPEDVTGVQGNGRRYEDNFAPYNQALRDLLARIGANAIDLPRLCELTGVRPRQLLGADGLHLSPTGNHIYADLIFDALYPLLTMGASLPQASQLRAGAG